MFTRREPHRSPFRLIQRQHSGFRGGLLKFGARLTERALGLHRMAVIHDRIRVAPSSTDYLERALESVGVEYEVPDGELDRVPQEGAVLAVSNHPYGVLDGILLGLLLRTVRPDVKILANHFRGRIEEVDDLFLFVDPLAPRKSLSRRKQPLREAIEWLKDGHLLVVFPAGEVSQKRWGKRGVTDPEWHHNVSGMARRSGASVLPMYVDGRNSWLFQIAGLIHPRLRNVLQGRELLNKEGVQIPIRVGNTLPVERLKRFNSERQVTDYLRLRTYILSRRVAGGNQKRLRMHLRSLLRRNKPSGQSIAPAHERAALQKEIDALPPEALLCESSGLQSIICRAHEIPLILEEIGRLRELTFREVGEGTGRDRDLDEHDRDYHHLFVWKPDSQELVGAYRIGVTDELLAKGGKNALYTYTLFDLDQRFIDHVTPGLEMGRSFVLSSWQRSYLPLMMLWKGIGTFVSRNPRYHQLFGPVSISRDYQNLSRQLIVEHLTKNNLLREMAGWARPRHPVRDKKKRGSKVSWTPEMMSNLGDVSEIVAEIETDAKGVPVLLREYLKLGGGFLGFNLDPEFSDVVDGLVLVDLRQTPERILRRYMGREEAKQFLAAK